MAADMTLTNDDKLKAIAHEGDIEELYKLIQEDAQVGHMLDMAETPLHIAASAGHLQFATEIMRLKPSYAWKLNTEGFSPIHLAVQCNQKKMVLRFVEINKDLVRVKGRESLTPLHIACQTGEIDLLVNFLSACPCSIEDVTVRGETALHIAVKNQQFEALRVLVGWLRRTSQRGAKKLEKEILNWKDEEGNTILHISASRNDSQALHLLVKNKMDLQAKNLENLTALNIARGNAVIEHILISAEKKNPSSVTDVPTLADKLRSKITILDKIIIDTLRVRRDISEKQRNAFLIVVTLVVTINYQSVLSPPGGFYQANASDDNVNTTSLNSTATATQGNAGKSVMPVGEFLLLSIYNTSSLLVSTIIIYILIPSGVVGSLLFTPVFLFVGSYIFSMAVIPLTLVSIFFIYISGPYSSLAACCNGDLLWCTRNFKLIIGKWKQGTVEEEIDGSYGIATILSLCCLNH